MGAYGMSICNFCGKEIHDLEEHTCKVDDLKNKIMELEDEIECMNERDD